LILELASFFSILHGRFVRVTGLNKYVVASVYIYIYIYKEYPNLIAEMA